ncbi:MAG: ABC transporter ATP-binding protein [Bacteroidales bacterium]|nr:ABC transporter ATP-binding protein [Bacteroidales bacterium]
MIQTIDLHKSFKRNHVLKGTSLSCVPGQIQALLGANGTGKSTLVHILAGLLKQDKGSCFMAQEEVGKNGYAYRKTTGYVFEHPMYIEKYTATEYLEFVARMYRIPQAERKSRVAELIEFFELPGGKKNYIENYSKGMKSKISLAAALIHNPSCLILDEPFDGIDFLLVQKIGTLFKSMAANGATILLTSHQYDVISEMCDHFALLKDGDIQFNVAFDELKTLAGKFAQDKNPVKSYLESLMGEGETKKSLNFIGAPAN